MPGNRNTRLPVRAADVEDGAVTIRAMPEAETDSGSRFPDSVPEIARAAFNEADICVSRLREILCDNCAIPF